MKTRLFVLLSAVTILSAAVMTGAGAAGDGPPLHVVHGQGIVRLSPPDGAIYNVTINVRQDESGVHGVVTWLNTFPTSGNPDRNGWQWVIEVDTLIMLADNEARVEGVIVQDNKYPWMEGERVTIYRIVDNGRGAADPPDRIFGVPILGGNFIVR